MKVFISWSGEISHTVAIALRDWIPSVIQAVDPFVSSEDIERGARWFSDIGNELETVNFGILCITPQNLNAPWVLFEAGALSKSVDQSRVSPLLLGVRNADLEGPLSQFNTTSIEKPEVFKLIKTINKQLGDSALPDSTIEKAFEKWWPELDSLLNDAVKEANKVTHGTHKHTRPQGEILEEILELTRGISRQVAKDDGDDVKNKLVRSLLLSRIKGETLDIPHITSNDLKYIKGIEPKHFTKWSNFLSTELDRDKIEKKKDDESDD